MKIQRVDRNGVWFSGRNWTLAYWPPKAWLPFSVRMGHLGRKGWWGAARLTRW